MADERTYRRRTASASVIGARLLIAACALVFMVFVFLSGVDVGKRGVVNEAIKVGVAKRTTDASGRPVTHWAWECPPVNPE